MYDQRYSSACTTGGATSVNFGFNAASSSSSSQTMTTQSPFSSATTSYISTPNPHEKDTSSSSELKSPRRKPGRKPTREVDPNHIPRPRNAFMCFRTRFKDYRKYGIPFVSTSTGLPFPKPKTEDNASLSAHIARLWNNLSEEESKIYYEEAKLELARHRIMHPNYKFRPKRKPKVTSTTKASSSTSTGSGRRWTKEEDPDWIPSILRAPSPRPRKLRSEKPTPKPRSGRSSGDGIEGIPSSETSISNGVIRATSVPKQQMPAMEEWCLVEEEPAGLSLPHRLGVKDDGTPDVSSSHTDYAPNAWLEVPTSYHRSSSSANFIRGGKLSRQLTPSPSISPSPASSSISSSPSSSIPDLFSDTNGGPAFTLNDGGVSFYGIDSGRWNQSNESYASCYGSQFIGYSGTTQSVEQLVPSELSSTLSSELLNESSDPWELSYLLDASNDKYRTQLETPFAGTYLEALEIIPTSFPALDDVFPSELDFGTGWGLGNSERLI